MKREILSFSDVRRLRRQPEFAFLAAVLLCGVLAGSFTGLRIPQAENSYAAQLAALLTQNAAGQLPTLRTTLLGFAGSFAWAAAVLITAKLWGKLIWTALVMAVRGFLLAFAAAAALIDSGIWGIYLSFVSIGISALFWVPAMLLLGTAALVSAKEGKVYRRALVHHAGTLMFCTVLLTLSVLWRLLAVPVLAGFGR